MNRVLLILGILLCTLGDGIAQNIQRVTGVVSDKAGITLPGVNIVNLRSKDGTITDANGFYSITAQSGDMLRFSYIGMETIDEKIAKSVMDITMSESSLALQEVVAIGYGTSTKKDLTGAVASIKLEDSPVMMMPNNNVLESLKGSLPGVNIGMGSSAGATPSFSIRGQNSIKAGTSPLLVVDGIIGGDFAQLNPQDIASVDVLKDASSTAVYGSRAANGVIIVTTKRGKTEKPQLNFSMNYGIQSWTRKPDLMNGDEYNQFVIDKAIAGGMTGSDLELQSLLKPKEYDAYMAGSEINWYDETTQSAPTQSYQLSISGANERFNYYVSGNYLKQEGLMIGDDFSRASVLAKLEADLTTWIKAGINVSGNRRDYSGMAPSMYSATYIGPWGFMNSQYEGYENWQERFPGGNTTWGNPLWEAFAIDDKDVYYNASLKGFLDIRLPWVEGLSWRINGAYNLGQHQEARFTHEEHYVNTLRESELMNPSQFLKNANGYAKDSDSHSWLINQILNYNKTFGEHKIDLTFMSERQRSHSSGVKATGQDFEQAGTTVLGYNSLEMGNAEKRGIDTWKSYASSLAYMLRANYVWRNRYHVSASFRRDGHSAFAEGEKYGNFTSAAVAWTLSEESFIKQLDWLSYMKLRFSYGENGNPSISSYSTFPKVGSGAYIFGNDYLQSLYQSSLANKKLGWERTKAFNLGLDFGVFNDRLSGNFEYYNSKTNDLLIERRLPITSGYTSIMDNMGEVANWGVEISLHSSNIETKNFGWTTDLSFWLNRNKINSLYGLDNDGDGKEDDDLSNSWFIGKSLGAIYGYESDGIVQESDKEYMETYNMAPGDIKIVDRNGNGKIDPEDKTIIGYSKPNFTMNIRNTLTYKNFMLSFSLDWLAGGGKNNYLLSENSKGMNPAKMPNANWLSNKVYWTPKTPVNDVPRPNYSDSYGYGFYQSRAFLRLQDITLSYVFDKKLLDKTKFFTNARIFVSGKNLLTFTGWDGLDPEAGQRIGEGSPSFKTYNIGLNVSF